MQFLHVLSRYLPFSPRPIPDLNSFEVPSADLFINSREFRVLFLLLEHFRQVSGANEECGASVYRSPVGAAPSLPIEPSSAHIRYSHHDEQSIAQSLYVHARLGRVPLAIAFSLPDPPNLRRDLDFGLVSQISVERPPEGDA